MQIRKIPKRKKGRLAKLGGALKGIGKGILAGPKKLAELGAKGAEKLYEFGKDALDKLGKLACGVVNHPAGSSAAAGGAAAYGVPPEVGAIGVELAKGICGGADVPGVSPEDLMAPPRPGLPGWVLPVGIGAAALVLVLALRRRA